MSDNPKIYTKGEIYAGLTNAYKEPQEVTQIRGVIATLVDNLEELDHDSTVVRRLVAMSQSKLEEACMFGVKAFYMSQQEK